MFQNFTILSFAVDCFALKGGRRVLFFVFLFLFLFLFCFFVLFCFCFVLFLQRQNFGTYATKDFLPVKYTNETTVGIVFDLSKPLTL